MKLYAWLLRLYPARFREEYSIPMERQFRDEWRDARSRPEKLRLYLNAIVDLATYVPVQIFHELLLDLKHAVRIYRRRSFTMTFAVIALGVSIGVSTGVFSVLNALLLRGLPFADPGRLVELWLSPVNVLNGHNAFAEWQRQSRYLEGAAAFSTSDMNLAGGREALRVKVAETTANFFQLLGAKPQLGRAFSRKEDVAGRNRVAVISNSLWQQAYGADRSVIGRTVHVDGAPFTIIGVMPAAFDYPGKARLWIPTAFDIETVPKRGAFLFRTIGRLKEGVTLQSAREHFKAEIRHFNPEALRSLAADERNRPHLTSLQNQLAGPVRQGSWVLAGLTFLLLLTACANVAQLLLSRSSERQQELELRAALGASRARLLQQLVTEATMLTTLGAMLGLLVAQWTCTMAASVLPAQLATQAYSVLDWRVLLFALSLAFAMGIIFGVLPAWTVGRLLPSAGTVRTQPGLRSSRTKRTRSSLIALQAALTFSLLISSFVVGRTFLNLLHTDLGFLPDHVVTLNVSLQGTKYSDAGEWQYYSQALEKLHAVPGVKAVGAVSYLPLGNDNIYMASSFTLDSGQKIEAVVMNSIASDYVRAIGTKIVAGHKLREPMDAANRSVIVNEAFAQRVGLGNQIVGRGIRVPWGAGNVYHVAGVVKTIRFGGPASSGEPQIYFPLEGEPPPALTLVARVSGASKEYLPQLRDVVRAIDPQVPIYDVKTLDQRLADNLARPRFYSTATLALSLLALLLAAAGVYGTTAYTISQQKREIGIRLAIGASQQGVRLMILKGSLWPLLAGTVAGALLSMAASGFLQHLVRGVNRPAVFAYAATAVFLLFIGVSAAWISTGRVLSIDPASCLRSE